MLDLAVRNKYFDAIWTGKKTVECRLNSAKYKDLAPGMKINFTVADTHKSAIATILAINTYPDFKSMLLAQGLENALPGVKTMQEGVKIYESFPKYKKNVKTTGVIAISFKLCSSADITAYFKQLKQENKDT